MPDKREIVINTGPIIAPVAALGDLSILRSLYQRLLIPYEVCQEIRVGGPNGFAVNEFEDASWLQKWPDPLDSAFPAQRKCLVRIEPMAAPSSVSETRKTRRSLLSERKPLRIMASMELISAPSRRNSGGNKTSCPVNLPQSLASKSLLIVFRVSLSFPRSA
jgi:hypothetical protein